MRTLIASFLVAGLLTGCYVGPSARAIETEASTPSRSERRAVVVLHEVDGNIFKFSVENLSNETMVLDRDRVFLSTPKDTVARLPGGAAHTYTLPPGAAHDLNVRFDLSSLEKGTRVEVQFDRALTVQGVHVDVAPIPFVVD
jgi:hypothetical protein